MAAKPIFEEKFSLQKVSSQLNVLFKWLQSRHLRNWFLFKMARKVLSRSISDKNSQNVRSLLNLLYTSEIALTFEKFSGQWMWRFRSSALNCDHYSQKVCSPLDLPRDLLYHTAAELTFEKIQWMWPWFSLQSFTSACGCRAVFRENWENPVSVAPHSPVRHIHATFTGGSHIHWENPVSVAPNSPVNVCSECGATFASECDWIFSKDSSAATRTSKWLQRKSWPHSLDFLRHMSRSRFSALNCDKHCHYNNCREKIAIISLKSSLHLWNCHFICKMVITSVKLLSYLPYTDLMFYI